MLPKGVFKESLHGSLIIPIGRNAGIGITDYAGHGAVFLAYPKDGPAGSQILEEFSRKDGPVQGVVPEGQDKDAGRSLLFHSRGVVRGAKGHHITLQSGGFYGLQHFPVHFSNKAEAEFFTEFQVSYRQQGTEAWTTVSKYSNGCVIYLTDLLPNTYYEVFVVTVCDNGLTSEPSDIYLFQTPTTGVDSRLGSCVNLYPNPAKEVVNVQCTMNNVQLTGELSVFDVYGKLLQIVPITSEITPRSHPSTSVASPTACTSCA